MATGIIETQGLSDSAVYAQVMANLRGAYNNYGVGSGNYPNVKGIAVNRILADVWMKNILDGKFFLDGQGVTVRNAGEGAAMIRIPLMAPPRYSMRTLSIAASYNGVLTGTPGNDGLENVNLPQIPQTNGVDLALNQIYDDATVIYQLSQDMLSLPIAGEYTAQIPTTVRNMEDTTVLATHLLGGLGRAAGTENSNVIDVDLSNTNEGYLQQIMNALISGMTNPQTSWSDGIVQFDLERSIIVVKQSFFNLLFSVRNGVLVSAGDLTQRMILGGAFTEDGKPKGAGVRGQYSGVWIKVVPDSYWRQAAACLGITAANYAQFDKVQGYIANADGFAFGRASASVNPIPNPGNAIGTKIQNLFRWGAQVVRPFATTLIVSGLSTFTNPIDATGRVVAPSSFNDTITSYGVSNVNYGDAQRVVVSEAEEEEAGG